MRLKHVDAYQLVGQNLGAAASCRVLAEFQNMSHDEDNPFEECQFRSQLIEYLHF
jgi:hypothetical protein